MGPLDKYNLPSKIDAGGVSIDNKTVKGHEKKVIDDIFVGMGGDIAKTLGTKKETSIDDFFPNQDTEYWESKLTDFN